MSASRWLPARRVAATAPQPRIAPAPWRDVYLDGAGATDEDVHVLVAALDALALRAVTAWERPGPPDEARMARILAGCVAVFVADAAAAEHSTAARVARRMGLAVLRLRRVGTGDAAPGVGCVGHESLAEAVATLPAAAGSTPPHAFMAVRIHDDFAQVRQAIAAAVETALGMPCVCFEDPRVLDGGSGVRERTARLIRGASFFVADLSFSASSPAFDSPNTAHEIGMALAFDVPVVVCAQAPRRNLYFSAGDLDTLFWRDEADLHQRLCVWLRHRRADLGCRVLNYEARDSRLAAPAFRFDAGRRHRGPPGLLRRSLARLRAALGLGVSGPSWSR